MGDVGRRIRAVLLVLTVLVGAGVADRVVSRGALAVAPPQVASAVTAGPSAQSSAWYCAAVAATPSGTSASLVVTNAGPRPVAGVLETVAPVTTAGSGPQSAPQSAPFTVAADASAVLGFGSALAAAVVVDGGDVAVMEVVSGPAGWSTAPCASSPADQWFFAHGSTTTGTGLGLVLFNPSATDAVVDVTFSSKANGIEAPPADQGLPVPATSAVLVNVGDHVPNDASVATTVTTLSGTVVADEMATVGPSGAVSIVNGVAAPLGQWSFPLGVEQAGQTTVFTLYDPGSSDAHVDFSVALQQGRLAPAQLVVPAGRTVSVTAESQSSIPRNTIYGAVFTVVGGPGIVVQREVVAPAGSAVPSDGMTVGQPGGSRLRRWIVPQLPPPASGQYGLSVVNLSTRSETLTIGVFHGTGLVPLPGASAVTLAPGAAAAPASWLQPPFGSGPLEVESTGPVAVELDPLPAGDPGAVVVADWPVLLGG